MRMIILSLALLALPLTVSGQTCSVEPCTNCGAPAAGVDADNDTIPDLLEYDLAYKYFPSVKLQLTNEDLNEAYPYLGRSIPFTVHPLPANGICDESRECLEIRWGMAFRRDHGDDYFNFIDPGHLGDSELYAAVVIRNTAWSTASTNAVYWNLIRDFTSAHWGTIGESSKYGAYGDCPCSSWNSNLSACDSHAPLCQSYAGFCGGVPSDPKYTSCDIISNEIQCQYAGCMWNPPICVNKALQCYSSSRLSGPVVLYASERKHGLYHTDGECEDGALGGADACPTNQYDLRSYISGRLQNIGNQSCNTSFDTSIQHPNFCDSYPIWTAGDFGASTPYRTHFNYAFDWALPGATQRVPARVLPTSCTSTPTTPGCSCAPEEGGCAPVSGAYISHFTGLGCTGEEYYYTPYFGSDGVRRSWDGRGCAGTVLRTVTNRSYRDSSGQCRDAWQNGNTLSGFVRIYR